jgi:dolichyl-phosphate-mannose--protein O-mannosyl transferase
VGPGLGLRPWRIVGGICLGLACGTKWSGLFFLATFAVMSVLWDVGARRAAGVRRWWLGGALRDGVPAFVSLVPVAALTYLVSWSGWFATSGGWNRRWGTEHPSRDFGFVPDPLRGLWHYHAEMYRFNVGLTSPHPYKTNPWSWLIQGRPTSFFYEGKKLGEDGCTVTSCSKAITSIGTPTLWWAALFAIFVLFYMWGLRRDWRAGAVLAGLLAGWGPWFLFQERTIYTFYAVAFVPWVVLAVTYLLGVVLGPARAPARRRLGGVIAAGSYVVTSVVLFFFFWPVYTAQVIPYAEWTRRMWFPSWV